MNTPQRKIRDALRDIIEGKIVKRSTHELVYAGKDLTQEFIEELRRSGYLPTTVAEVDVQPGERVPAFTIEGTSAHFGWVFWERFTSRRLRKLWGSVRRNARGDWEIQIPPTRSTTLYANASLKLDMDIDHPVEI